MKAAEAETHQAAVMMVNVSFVWAAKRQRETTTDDPTPPTTLMQRKQMQKLITPHLLITIEQEI